MAKQGGTETKILDLRGLKCPLPAMKARKALNRLEIGAVLTVLATDPMSAIDIPHAIAQGGGTLTGQSCDDAVLSFTFIREREA